MRFEPIFALALTVAVKLAAQPAPSASTNYEIDKSTAERFYADGSYAKANEAYSKVDISHLSSDEARWVVFRLADTQWRSQAATDNRDTTKLDQAGADLQKQIRDLTREDQHDRIWAEVQESLGDFSWTRRNHNDWGGAWPHYQAALEWWAGAPDLELARQRYLAMVWRMARPPQMEASYFYGYWGNYVPLEVLDNALKIARSDNDKAHAHYLIAMTLRNQGGGERERARVPGEFEDAIALGKGTDWYGDAIYNYGEWMMSQGNVIPLANGGWQNDPDYIKALEMFRRITTEFKKGETRYWEQAQQQIQNITDPQVYVGVGNVFLPDSEIQYQLGCRNVKEINFALYPIELNRDVQFPQDSVSQEDWLHTIRLDSLEAIRKWSRQTGDKGDYKPGNETIRYEGKLKPGAYVLESRGAGKENRELILVSDATLVLKSSGRQALVYFCNAVDSSPLGSSKVTLWERWWDNRDRRWHARSQSKGADTNGIAVFDLAQPDNYNNADVELFAGAISDDRQAFAIGNGPGSGESPIRVSADPRTGIISYLTNALAWHIYAFTDRPAYRPKETVNWKFIARCYNGSVYSTPTDETLHYRISAPDNSLVKEGDVKLNEFGSAFGSLDLTETMRLGEYSVTFRQKGGDQDIGEATLFRLEEYKLPEFKVEVTTPRENGQKKNFRLGDKVEASIQADYYFGGPVSDASVEVLVYQNPFWHLWHEPRSFPWFYEDMDNDSTDNYSTPFGGFGRRSRNRWYGGGEQIIKRETIKTDATGKAIVTFDTPENANQDYEYRIEARVTDSSRREITGTGTVRVTRQHYYVYAEPAHCLYQPQDKVTVNFKTLDANEQPVKTDGSVKVTRDYWYEIWLAPDGHEVKGDELKQLRTAAPIWPPPPARPDQKDWRLKFRGYEHDDILTRSLKTDTNGEAQLDFTPDREGYYRVEWTSDDAYHETIYATFTNHITAETTVWVCTDRSTDLGYRHDGVEIIADKDTFRVGQTAPVMLVSRTPDRYVLFSVEGEDLYNYHLVHLEGTVKLVNLPVEEKHVPNIFLDATLVDDRQIFNDTKQIIIPPTKNFLTVDVKPDRSQYQPRDEGTFLVTTKNDEGKPISAEVALSLVDESVFYIQNDYAGDPRQFYFGTKRQHPIQTQSTMNQKTYAKLVVGDNNQLIDDRELERQKQIERNRGGIFQFDELNKDRELSESAAVATYGDFGGGGGGGFGGRRVMAMNAPAAASAALADEPAPATPPAQFYRKVTLGAEMQFGAGQVASGGEEPAIVVRSDFRSTVFWQPDIVTDQNGSATVKVKYPDSLTSWKATARAVSEANQFGIAETNTHTKQPLIVRLEAPRFFVVGDTVTISAVINNNTDEPIDTRVALEASGLAMGDGENMDLRLKIPANGESRADWTANVKTPGDVKLKVTARGGKYADAMEKTFTAYEHGIEKFISKSGKARGNDITVNLDLPRDRKSGSTSMTVQVTPSTAVTMLDALPYLADYPYGCTEQTMSRFLPSVITAKTLRDLGLQPEDVMGRAFGGIETNFAAATHPKGKKNLEMLNDMTDAGLKRLYDFQHGDGGWGWWKEGDSDHWMTAYVVWGLSLARDAGVDVKADVLQRAARYLDENLVEEEENADMQAWMLYAYSTYVQPYRHNSGLLGKFIGKAENNLWDRRDQLNAYTRALFALAEHNLANSPRARTLIENLENGVVRDNQPDTSILISGQPTNLNGASASVPGTAHWGEDGVYWRWSDGGVEATAFALRAMLAIDPTNELIEPVTNWLIKNRRGAQWNSTRDTAIVVLALNDYLRVSGELKADVEYEVFVNGSSIARKKLSGADVFNAPSRFAIDPKLIKDNNSIRIVRKSGNSPIFFAAAAKFFSTEEPITPAGNEIFVKREYYKLVGRSTLLKGLVYDKEPLRDGDTVKSGERVQAVLTIEGKNNFEYLLFEDLKPAGLEAVDLRSGESLYAKELKSGAAMRKFADTNKADAPQMYLVKAGDTLSKIARASGTSLAALREANNLAGQRIKVGQKIIIPRPQPAPDSDYTGRARWVYQELRDRKVAMFIDKLPEGIWEIRYDFRAEVPGQFHALPVLGQAMYVPEIRANSAEMRINVADTEK